MTETLPRWGLNEIEFLTTDAARIQSEIITAYENVTGRVLADGDPVRLFLLSIASILISQRNTINMAAQQNLLSYAQGEYLDALGNYLSVTRLADGNAVTTLEFTLSQGLANAFTIPAGFEVTNGIVTFATDAELTIGPGDLKGSVQASCNESGSVGNNFLAGQISTIVRPMAFLASAENTTITTGGADAEADAEFAERIKMAPNSFSVAGPAKAYVFHTMSVSSAIIDVSVTSPTPGEVNIYPLLTEGTLPTQSVLDQIEAHLNAEDIRPLTDYVVVKSPVAYPYNIQVDYWISNNDRTKSEMIRTNVEAAVERYRLWQQSRIGRDITPAQLIAEVVRAGAARIDAATMHPPAFVELQPDQVAQSTTVTINYKGYKDD